MKNKLLKYKQELQSTHQKINQVKKQITALNAEGEKLVAHANFLNGKIEALNEVISESESESESDAECQASEESP